MTPAQLATFARRPLDVLTLCTVRPVRGGSVEIVIATASVSAARSPTTTEGEAMPSLRLETAEGQRADIAAARRRAAMRSSSTPWPRVCRLRSPPPVRREASAIGFDVSSHPDARSKVARDMLAALPPTRRSTRGCCHVDRRPMPLRARRGEARLRRQRRRGRQRRRWRRGRQRRRCQAWTRALLPSRAGKLIHLLSASSATAMPRTCARRCRRSCAAPTPSSSRMLHARRSLERELFCLRQAAEQEATASHSILCSAC